MEEIRIIQMTPYELENLIERVLIKVLNKYVEKQQTRHEKPKVPQPDSKILNFQQAADFTGYARSYLYKLTSQGIIPHSKPNGKEIFFDKAKLEEWMLSGASLSRNEREVNAATYVTTHN